VGTSSLSRERSLRWLLLLELAEPCSIVLGCVLIRSVSSVFGLVFFSTGLFTVLLTRLRRELGYQRWSKGYLREIAESVRLSSASLFSLLALVWSAAVLGVLSLGWSYFAH
jgi:hypothetical protein